MRTKPSFRTRPEARSATHGWIHGNIDGTEDYALLGSEGVLNLGPVQAGREYQHVWLDRDEGFGQPASICMAATSMSPTS